MDNFKRIVRWTSMAILALIAVIILVGALAPATAIVVLLIGIVVIGILILVRLNNRPGSGDE